MVADGYRGAFAAAGVSATLERDAAIERGLYVGVLGR
jgi:hypothetical protein